MSYCELTTKLIAQKIEDAQLRSAELHHQVEFIHQMRRTIFSTVNIVADQTVFCEELEGFLQNLSKEVNAQMQTIKEGESRSRAILDSLLKKQEHVNGLKESLARGEIEKKLLLQKIKESGEEELELVKFIDQSKSQLFNSSQELLQNRSMCTVIHERLIRSRATLSEQQDKTKRNQTIITALQLKIDQYSKEISKLSIDTDKKNHEIATQQSQISKQQQDLAELTNELTVVSQHLKAAEIKYSQYASKIDDQKLLIDFQHKEISRINSIVEETRFLLDGQEVLISQNENKIWEQKKQIDQNNILVTQQESRLLRNKYIITNQEKFLENNLKRLHLTENQLHDEVVELNMQTISIKHNRNSIIALKKKIREDESKLHTMRNQITINHQTYNSQKVNIAKYCENISRLEDGIQQESLLLASLESSLQQSCKVDAEKKQTAEHLDMRLFALKGQTHSLQTQITESEKKISFYSKQIDELVASIHIKEDQLKHQNEIIEEQRKLIISQESQIHQNSILNATLVNSIDSSELNLAKQQIELKKSTILLSSSEDDFYTLSNGLSILQAQILQNEAEATSIEQNVCAYRQQIDELMGEKTKLEKSLLDLNAQIDSNRNLAVTYQRDISSQSKQIEDLLSAVSSKQMELDRLKLYCEQTSELIAEQGETILRYKAENAAKDGIQAKLKEELNQLQDEMKKQCHVISNEEIRNKSLDDDMSNILTWTKPESRWQHQLRDKLSDILPPGVCFDIVESAGSIGPSYLICKKISLNEHELKKYLLTIKKCLGADQVKSAKCAKNKEGDIVGLKLEVLPPVFTLRDPAANKLVA